MIRMKNLAKIMNAAKKYKTELLSYSKSIQDLLTKGYLKKIPEDPMNATYRWDKEKNLPII